MVHGLKTNIATLQQPQLRVTGGVEKSDNNWKTTQLSRVHTSSSKHKLKNRLHGIKASDVVPDVCVSQLDSCVTTKSSSTGNKTTVYKTKAE